MRQQKYQQFIPMHTPHSQEKHNQHQQCHTGHNSITESQIITSLNFSIEDLLSKISKVKEDYEISTHQLNSSHPHLHHGGSHASIQDQIVKQKEKTFCNIYQSSDAPSTQKSQKHSLKDSQNEEESQKRGKHFSIQAHKPMTLSSPRCPSNHQHNSDTGSLKLIQTSSFNDDNLLKMNKIHSLFDDYAIKQVAESKIFSEQQGEGSCLNLDKNVRMIKQSMIQSYSQQGLQLSDFQLGKQVGSGKFGEVYMCIHKQTGFIFALKKIFKSTIKEYKMQSQFLLQMKILYLLDHPNIVKLYGHFCDEYHLFLLMEYIQGGQLMSRLKSNEQYVSRVVDQLTDAIGYIHNRSIVHRDIKPQNIVMAFDNTAKLCDFGWAGEFDSKALKTTFCGTLDYVSPQMKDKGKYTSKVDLWSLGVLTYQLLTGEAPFRDQISQWRKRGGQRHMQWDWHILYPPNISGLAQSFMRNLLKQNPDERASLRFCKNHFFLRKHREQEQQNKTHSELHL